MLVCIACLQPLRGQQKIDVNGAIDQVVRQLMDTAGVTGLCLGLVKDNKVAYVKGYGFKNRLMGQRNDTATVFYAASLAKPLFAYLVMRLVDEGKIDLDKPLFTYLPKPLPEYEHYQDLAGDERWKLITARHCLAHTTGFPNWRQLNPNRNGKLEIFFSPGERYAYSGEGLCLLQLVVETISGQNLEALARKYVFTPAGMPRSAFLWQPAFETNYAVGHNADEDTIALARRTMLNAAGSMVTTIADYTRFMAYVMQGNRLSSRSKQEVFSPQIGIYTEHQFPSLNNDTSGRYRDIQLSYGLGWGLFESANGKAFFKEGHSDDGWQHYVIGFPDQGGALVLMTNSLNGESIFKELVEVLTGALIPWEWEGYAPYRPTVQVPERILSQYVGDYTGPAKAKIFMENGRLKVESPSEGLPKTNLYAVAENRFFTKTIPVNIEFIRSANGDVQKASVWDEGVAYELIKENSAAFQPAEALLAAYLGKYELVGSTGRVITIERQKEGLIVRLGKREVMQMIFSSDTAFRLQSPLDIRGVFVLDNGAVTKMIIEQEGRHEWRKVQ